MTMDMFIRTHVYHSADDKGNPLLRFFGYKPSPSETKDGKEFGYLYEYILENKTSQTVSRGLAISTASAIHTLMRHQNNLEQSGAARADLSAPDVTSRLRRHAHDVAVHFSEHPLFISQIRQPLLHKKPGKDKFRLKP